MKETTRAAVYRLRRGGAAVSRRLDAIRYDPPVWSLKQALILFVVVVLTVLAGAWYLRHQRDIWWRAQIAERSSGVRAAMAAGDRAAELTDQDILQKLEATDVAQKRAEDALKKLNGRPAERGADNRCSVPVSCLDGLR